jgi:hypothetical protein
MGDTNKDTYMMMFPKYTYYRSKTHLKNVASLLCQHCGRDGSVQAAHSNWSEHGKGRGIKASDIYTAALCQDCHQELDQGNHLSKEERKRMWIEAHKKTVFTMTMLDLWPRDIGIPLEYD